jgi:hypothetical protein
MALFFGVLYAQGSRGLLRAFQMSLVFSYVIGLLLWVMKQFVMPRLPGRPGESHTAGVLRVSFTYTLTSIFGAAIAAWIVDRTVMPGFLGSGRTVAIVGMYTLLFSVLFTGVILAFIFYRIRCCLRSPTSRARASPPPSCPPCSRRRCARRRARWTRSRAFC